jgi:hypothetical protein
VRSFLLSFLGVFTFLNPPKFEINERLSTSRKRPHLRMARCTLMSLFHVIYHMLIPNWRRPHDSGRKMVVIFKRCIFWGGGGERRNLGYSGLYDSRRGYSSLVGVAGGDVLEFPGFEFQNPAYRLWGTLSFFFDQGPDKVAGA